ncbi:allose kinase [Acholeplasma hippikon]|uniref:D-allose kinase n=1 Tax=Acholeplasma hippikon TaxID=264636 RepID=A0A449BII6_9MOLU|nr:allose kinase [Acholeplasma hippikon]VEU82276.1 D-allose kinase [Acholeplasma hippikon]
MEKYYIGIDVGGTNVRMGLVDEKNNILFEEKHKSQPIAHKLDEVVKDFVNKYKNDYHIVAISMGFPGLVDQETRAVIDTPNIRALEGNYLMKLEQELNIPIILGNDVNYLLMYDAEYFNINPKQSVLGFYLGTGFGNAIRIKDELYQGDNGAAGEIGHVPQYLNGINYNDKQSDLESYVSGFKLVEIHKKHFNQTPFERLFIDHFDSKEIQDYLHLLGFYIAAEITILDIATIILGGGVIMSEQFPREYLEKIVKRNLHAKVTVDKLKFYYAESQANSGILGATIYAKNYLSKNQK